MAPQDIRIVLHAHPFTPFKVRLPDGEELPVPTPDHAEVSPGGGRLVIFTDDDRMRIIDPLLVSSLELAAP